MALPTPQTYNVPGNSSRSVEEPKVTAAISSVDAEQDNWREYLDRDGTTYPGASNTGLEEEFLAPKSAQSLQLSPQGGATVLDAATAIVTPGATTTTFLSTEFAITTTFNAKILFFATIFVIGSTSSYVQGRVFIEQSASSGFAAGTGTPIINGGGANFGLFGLAANAGTAQVDEIPITVTADHPTGTRYYRVTAIQTVGTPGYGPARSPINYFVINDFS